MKDCYSLTPHRTEDAIRIPVRNRSPKSKFIIVETIADRSRCFNWGICSPFFSQLGWGICSPFFRQLEPRTVAEYISNQAALHLRSRQDYRVRRREICSPFFRKLPIVAAYRLDRCAHLCNQRVCDHRNQHRHWLPRNAPREERAARTTTDHVRGESATALRCSPNRHNLRTGPPLNPKYLKPTSERLNQCGR